jgi:Fe-S-cluster-containing hydrogenase component 2
MSCGECFDCENCYKYCQDSAVVRPDTKGGEYKFKLENCIGCDKCAEACPCGYIDMRDMSGK